MTALPATNDSLPREAVPSFPAATSLDFSGAACFWKGRVALYAILRTLGLGPGDRVIVPGYTCVVVPAAVYFAGAEPVYADIDPRTFNLTLESVERAANVDRVRAVIVQHTYGLPAEIGPLCNWAAARGIFVIEDCCHALGSAARDSAQDAWRPVGTWGDAAFFSSQWSKPIATGLGGWAIARSPELQARLCAFAEREAVAPSWRDSSLLAAQVLAYKAFFRPALFWQAQGALRWLARRGWMIGSSGAKELELQFPTDYAQRMAPWQRRLMLRGARHMSSYIAQRRALQALYEAQLAAAGWPVMPSPDDAAPVWLRYPVRVANKAELLAAARAERVELGDWFDHPLHPRGLNLAPLGWREGLCPHGEKAAAEVVNLPLHARIKLGHVLRAVELLSRVGRPAQ